MKDFLNEKEGTLLSEFWDFSKDVERLLEQFSIAPKFPIDIEKMAKELGFCIKESIEYGEEFSSFYAYASQNFIVFRKNLMYKEKRWIIAKVVTAFLINNGEIKNIINIPDPFFINNNVDEFYSDALAILLLLPIFLFKKEIYEHMGKSNNLLQELSNKAQIPMMQLASGYQLIKLLLCFQRSREFIKANYDTKLVSPDQYEDIFI